MEPKRAVEYVGRCYKTVCVIFFNKKHLKRDAFILGAFVVILVMVWVVNSFDFKNDTKGAAIAESAQVLGQEAEPRTEEEAVATEEKTVVESIDKINTETWTPYQNAWYGFTLKYPDVWKDPIVRKAVAGATWEQKVEFRAEQTKEENPFEGFDMVVYSLARVKNLENMDEFPKLKSEELRKEENCKIIEGHLLETGDYPAEEIYVPANDACYNAALYFTNTRGAYTYNLVPKFKEGWGLAGDPAKEIETHMPEFFAVASTLELTDIVRPKPVVVKPKITAPKPASYKVVGGKMVCEKSNDKPSKSDKNKGRHLDMECCLDPDEYPNPWCSYDPGKYGKYLK